MFLGVVVALVQSCKTTRRADEMTATRLSYVIFWSEIKTFFVYVSSIFSYVATFFVVPINRKVLAFVRKLAKGSSVLKYWCPYKDAYSQDII